MKKIDSKQGQSWNYVEEDMVRLRDSLGFAIDGCIRILKHDPLGPKSENWETFTQWKETLEKMVDVLNRALDD